MIRSAIEILLNIQKNKKPTCESCNQWTVEKAKKCLDRPVKYGWCRNYSYEPGSDLTDSKNKYNIMKQKSETRRD